MKPGRNDPCPCGSGKKFKKCCQDKSPAGFAVTTSQKAQPDKRKAMNPDSHKINALLVLFNAGRYAEAAALAKTMTEHYPASELGWKVLGASNKQLGRSEYALEAMQKVAALTPSDADAHYNLGIILQDIGQFDNAIASYRRALKIKPDFVWAHINLGNAFKDLGQLGEAAASYSCAVKIKPDHAESYFNLGNALKDLALWDAAAPNYRRAIEHKPNYNEAHCNLGIVLQNLGQLNDAVTCYRRALDINPLFVEAHTNLGVALQDLGQYENAIACHHRAIEINPASAEAHSNLGNILKDYGRLEEAAESFLQALEINPEYTDTFSNLLFVQNYSGNFDPVKTLETTRRFGTIVSNMAGKQYSSWLNTKQSERLRVGMVSGDFRKHPVGYFLEGLLEHIDPTRIELIAYPTYHVEDELSARIRPRFSEWKPLYGKSDEAAAQMIHADGLHVLLDLSGHTRYNRLRVFAWKPAPVQATWLGYFATTGVAEIDYLLADKEGVPDHQQGQFTEAIKYLPETRLCFTAPEMAIPVVALPAISNGFITFACFQNLPKLGEEVLAAWGEIFAALPNARLRIQNKQLDESVQAAKLLQRLQAHGIDSSKVALHGATPRAAYLAAHGEVDILLDTFPYPGGTTTCEALWMGVPTLTLAGTRLVERQGASLLVAAGLEEWVSENRGEYIAKAISFSSDLEKLAKLRAGLREQVLKSPLFDAPRFAANFEKVLWEMSGLDAG